MSDYECKLDAVGLKRASDELGEIETDREAAVQALREWVLAQDDWLKSPTDTQFLLGFLRQRKFSQKAAKERLVQFWEIRPEYPDWFTNIDPAEAVLQDCYRQGIFQKLPKRDQDGCTVFLGRIGRINLKSTEKEMDAQNRSMIANMDQLLRDDMFQACGVKIFHDFTGVTVEHLIKLEGAFKRFTRIILDAYPIRIRAICYYNVGPVFDLLFVILRKFLPKKIRDRVSTHTSLQTVYDKIDKSVLPVEYLPDDSTGPHAGHLDVIVENYAKMMNEDEVRDYVMGLSSGEYYCDATKRPDDVIPTESFRSLKI